MSNAKNTLDIAIDEVKRGVINSDTAKMVNDLYDQKHPMFTSHAGMINLIAVLVDSKSSSSKPKAK